MTQKLHAWTVHQSFMLQLIKFVFRFLAQNKIKQYKIKQNNRDTIKRTTRLKIYATRIGH